MRLDLLGERMGAPEPGALAQQAGDRPRLLAGADRWVDHDTRWHALDAALASGDLERAVELAHRYVETPSAALRLRAAALLCVGGDSARGMREAALVERERAEQKKANFATDFGSARLVVEACAALGGVAAPALPPYGQAGAWDQRARILAHRSRVALAGQGWAAGERALEVRQLLTSGHARPFRLELVALIASSLEHGDEAWQLGRARAGGPSLSERIPRVADDLVDPPRGRPFLPPALWEAAAEHLAGLEGMRPELVVAVNAQAVMAHALAGDLAAADGAAARIDDAALAARMATLAALLIGDRNEARRRIEESESSDAASEILRAELRMPDRMAAKEAARRALEAAERERAPRLVEHASWLIVALGEQSSDARVPPRVPDLGPVLAYVPPAARQADLAEVLATWQSWLAEPVAARRSVRWTLFRHRGDAPHALAAYLACAGALADRPEQIEIWLDAVLAQDARRWSLRRYALARWRAAAWRGDAAAARSWRSRFLRLRELAAVPATADLMQEAGL
jgi:hypothetical protein